MKYNNAFNGDDFSKYKIYLDSIKDKLSKIVYEFAYDVNRHNFEKTSLHDSWLKSFEVKTDFEKRLSTIKLVLLGAYHDREFHFLFKGVRQYNLNQAMQDISRDLLTFEIGIENNCYNESQKVFRAEFSMGEMVIYSDEIEIEEKFI